MPVARMRCLYCPPPGSDQPCERCEPPDDEQPVLEGRIVPAYQALLGEGAPRTALAVVREGTTPDYSGSCMLALYPPADVARALSVDGGLDPAGMHVTVAYTGDAADVDRKQLRKAAAKLARRGAPFTAKISGHARFTGSGDQDVIVALVDAPELEQLRGAALKQLGKQNIDVPSGHGYTAHMTIAYLGRDEPSPVTRLPGRPVRFTAVTASHGDNRRTYPFARAEQVTETLTEVTIDLSKLEGIWATVYGRQDALQAKQVRAARREWQAMIAGLDLTAFVAAFMSLALMLPGMPAPGTDHPEQHVAKWHKTELRRQARSMASGFLAGLPDHPGWEAFLTVVTVALTKAAGEGFAAALGIAAAEAGHAGFNWRRAARDGQTGPSRQQVQNAAKAIVAGTVTDLAVALAALAIGGATVDKMTRRLQKILRTGRALTVYLTDAMARANADAMAQVYADADVRLLDWVTAGDRKVCASCEDHEARNPWRLEDFPPMPDHPGCRCVQMPAGLAVLPPGLYATYLQSAA